VLQNFLIGLAVLIALVGVVALGFVMPPRPFRSHPAPTRLGAIRPLPPDLPAPVRRHLLATAGAAPAAGSPAAGLPAIETAVVWGRGRACIRDVWMPLRFKSWYRPGRAFYRRVEITWFQRPVLRGMEYLIDGLGVVQVGEREERGPTVDQSQTFALWAEAVWTPAFLAGGPGRWEPVDDTTARLVFPYQGGEESLLAYFDPESGRMTHILGSRFRAAQSTQKEPWRLDILAWKTFHDMEIPCQVSVAWGEAGAPWAYWNLDGVAYNVNVSDQLPEEVAGS
jgi:hypothetical protein